MNNLLRTFAEISVTSSVVIILAALLNKLTYKKYSVRWKYYIWIILAVRMMLPFHFGIIEVPVWPLTAQSELWDSGNQLSQGNYIASDIPVTRIEEENGTTDLDGFLSNEKDKGTVKENNSKSRELTDTVLDKGFPIDFFLFLPILWIFGIMAFSLYHFLTYVIFLNRLNRWMIPVIKEDTKKVLSELKTELSIKKEIKLVVCKFVSSPMLIGIIHPKIILPSEETANVQLRIILKHELIHYRHHDLYYKFLLLFVNAIHWFNPIVYYMVKLANNDMELYCDEEVIRTQNEEYRRLYSFTILETITKQSADKLIAFSTYFYGGKKQMKNRFSQIMNMSPKKKGITFFSILLCLILLTGNLAASGEKDLDTKSPVNQNAVLLKPEQSEDEKDTEPAKTSRFLLAGIDGIGGVNRADSILMVTVRPDLKTITLTSFLRDMYVEIPGEGKNKLNAAYSLGGTELLKRTLEINFGLKLDGTVSVDFSGFEQIIDQLGGIELPLTEKEVSYLNKTNFISNPDNRTLITGNQILNGNQALGYLRIRQVETSDGLVSDFGRTARQRRFLQTVYEKCCTSDLSNLISILDTSLSYVTTDLEENQIITYLTAALSKDYTFDTLQIPAEGTYEAIMTDGMSVLKPDIAANLEVLKN